MPFKSLTDAEYEDIFKAAIGDCYEVESSYMGDICKSLAYTGINKRKTAEDEVVTPNENEALTPSEAANQKSDTTLPTTTENVSQKPKKVKLFSAHEVIGEKKIIPVFKSKPKTKIKDHPANNATQKCPQKPKEHDNPEQEHQSAKSGKKIRRDDPPDHYRTIDKTKECPQKPKEHDNPEQEHQSAKSVKKIRRDDSPDHYRTINKTKECSQKAKEHDNPGKEYQNAKSGKKIRRDGTLEKSKTTIKNKDSDETCFATPAEKASSVKLDKKSSETTAISRKGKKNVDKDKINSDISSSATVESTCLSKRTTNKSNLSSHTNEVESATESDELPDECHSSNQTATSAPSGEVLTKERYCKLTASSTSKVDSESSQLVPSQQEIPLSQPPAQYNLKQRLKWLQVRREVGVWVQCCNESCSKWRYLESTRDPQQVPRRWFCNMNPDKSLASCAAPQKGPSLMQELDLIENQYTAGSVVWARLTGYPWWPAMVDDDPDVEQYYWITTLSDIPTHYNVVFFDEKQPTRAWITPKNLRPFNGNESRREYNVTVHRGIDYSKRLAVAKAQATEALEMDFKQRLQNFSFLARFKGPFVMNTRSALSNKYIGQSQEEFQDNDDMIKLLKEVKHRRKHSLATSNTCSQKRPEVNENTNSKSIVKSRSAATINPLQNRKRKNNKLKKMEKELGLSKHLESTSKQLSETNTQARLSDTEVPDTKDSHNKKAQDRTVEQNNEALPCVNDVHHEKQQDRPKSADDDSETVMSEDMFGDDDSTQFESDHDIRDSKSSSAKQNEHPQETPVIKPEDNQHSVSSGKILTNLVPMVCTNDEQESKSSVNIQKIDEPEQVPGDSAQIPSSLQAIVGTGGAEETTSSTKDEPRYHNEQSSSFPSTSHSYIQSGCKAECSDLRKVSPSKSLNDSTHASPFVGETREQLSSCANNNTGVSLVSNAGESCSHIEAIPEVPLVEYPDDAVVPQGFSPSTRESSPDFEAEE